MKCQLITCFHPVTALKVMPRLKEGGSADGMLKASQLRRASYVEQLNAAGREVAHHLRMCVLDTAVMTAGLSEELRLSDDTHPSYLVWEEVLSLLLNIDAQHREGGPGRRGE